MEKDKPAEVSVREAVEIGYSEADVSLDLEGYDSLAKLMILLNALSDRQQSLAQFVREGITNITVRDVQSAREKSMRYRMVAHAWREEDASWRGQVGPVKMDERDPLYYVKETRNAVQIKSETVGDIYLEGPGSGRLEVGYSMLLDLLSIYVP
jgi:homoserine dehydrogenase